MGKLIKYELKGNYKIFLGTFIVTALLNILLLTRVNVWNPAAIVALFSLITMALFLLVLVFVLKSFKNEMYEDRAYLTFTLPISGNKIVAAKIISALIWFAGAALVILIFFGILVGYYADKSVIDEINMYINIKASILLLVLFCLINLIMMLLMIYFSITLTRVALRRKKMSGFIGFIVCIALTIAIFYIEYHVIKLFPQTFNLKVDFLQGSQANGGIVTIDGESLMTITKGYIHVNIASIIYNIIIYIGLFLSTGYLIDNKIDI